MFLIEVYARVEALFFVCLESWCGFIVQILLLIWWRFKGLKSEIWGVRKEVCVILANLGVAGSLVRSISCIKWNCQVVYLGLDVEVENVLKWCFAQLFFNDDIGSLCCCVISLVLRNALIVFKFVMLWNVYFLSLCLWLLYCFDGKEYVVLWANFANCTRLSVGKIECIELICRVYTVFIWKTRGKELFFLALF